jgi:hypothetical protein
MAVEPTGSTAPPSVERFKRVRKAAEPCGLVCFNAKADAKLILFSFLQAIALPAAQPAAIREGIITEFRRAAMEGRDDDVVLEFPIIFGHEVKPKNAIKRHRLRSNLEGQ